MPQQGNPGTDKNLYCSFCGKSSKDVAKLIAGPTAYICDECVELCTEIVVERNGEPALEAAAFFGQFMFPEGERPPGLAYLIAAPVICSVGNPVHVLGMIVRSYVITQHTLCLYPGDGPEVFGHTISHLEINSGSRWVLHFTDGSNPMNCVAGFAPRRQILSGYASARPYPRTPQKI